MAWISRLPFPVHFTHFQTKPNGKFGLYLLMQKSQGMKSVRKALNEAGVGNMQEEATVFKHI